MLTGFKQDSDDQNEHDADDQNEHEAYVQNDATTQTSDQNLETATEAIVRLGNEQTVHNRNLRSQMIKLEKQTMKNNDRSVQHIAQSTTSMQRIAASQSQMQPMLRVISGLPGRLETISSQQSTMSNQQVRKGLYRGICIKRFELTML